MRNIAAVAAVLAVAATAFAPVWSPAWAQDIGEPPLDQATIDLITAAVAARYADPEAVVIDHLRKSLARNGRGYCGEVTVEAGGEATTFHLVFDEADKASVLVLSDYPDPEASANAATVHRLMHNFGCVE